SCLSSLLAFFFFFLTDPPPTEIYTLSLHDALPIYVRLVGMDAQAIRAVSRRIRCPWSRPLPRIPGGSMAVLACHLRLGREWSPRVSYGRPIYGSDLVDGPRHRPLFSAS